MKIFDKNEPVGVDEGLAEVVAQARRMLAGSGLTVFDAFAELERNPDTDDVRATQLFGLWKTWKRLLVLKER